MAAHANGPQRQSKYFAESHGKSTRRPNLEVYNSLFRRLHHFISHNRRTHRAPTRSFSKVQRRQSQNQYDQMCFFSSDSTILGHIVSREGVQVDSEKTCTVNNYPVPKNATEVKSILGLCSYYRRYLQDFAKIALPLHQLTEKSKDFLCNCEAQEIFEVLKARLTSAPILAFPSMRETFILYNDARQHAMDAVVAQIQNGSEGVIGYASKSFSKAQSRYSTTKREFLAIVNFTRHFKHYLLG